MPVCELSEPGVKFHPDDIDDVTGHVKVEIFGLDEIGEQISMLNANKANESSWISESVTFS